MNTYQILFMLVLYFIWISASSNGAFILLYSYALYSILVISDIDASHYIYYYSIAASINLMAGLFLQSKYKLTAIFSYLLVLTNVFGAWLWYRYYPPTLYDNISFILLFIQLLTLIPKGVINGIRHYWEYIMVKSHVFDRFQSNVTMHKKKKQKEKAFR